MVLLATAARARPEYAAKENKPCSYCHVNPNGGGARNANGIYYGSHNHSFAGMTTSKGGDKGKRLLHYTLQWKIDVPAGTRRIDVADVTEDKQMRLLTLGEDSTLTIHRVTANGVEKETSVDLGDGADRFSVGHFAKGRPAMIAIPGALFYKDGDKYTRKDVPAIRDVLGAARFTDGTENIIALESGHSKTWAVDLDADRPLVPGKPLVRFQETPGVLRKLVIHTTPKMLMQIGFSEDAAKAGVAGGLDPHGDDRFYLFAPVTGGLDSYLELFDVSALSGEAKPAWKSGRLAGKALDIATGRDPKGAPQTGFFVLEQVGDDGKGRAVEFFALDK